MRSTNSKTDEVPELILGGTDNPRGDRLRIPRSPRRRAVASLFFGFLLGLAFVLWVISSALSDGLWLPAFILTMASIWPLSRMGSRRTVWLNNARLEPSKAQLPDPPRPQ